MLSALEYAYLAGDVNFIQLFERLGEGCLAGESYKNILRYREEYSRMIKQFDSKSALESNIVEYFCMFSYAPIPFKAIEGYFYEKLRYQDIDQSTVLKNGLDLYSDEYKAIAARIGSVIACHAEYGDSWLCSSTSPEGLEEILSNFFAQGYPDRKEKDPPTITQNN